MPTTTTSDEPKVATAHQDEWNVVASTSTSEATLTPSKRASRHNKISNEIEHFSFTRTTTTTITKENSSPSSSTTTTQYRIGDCIIINDEIAQKQKFLHPPIYQIPLKVSKSKDKGRGKGKEKQVEEYEGWKHEDGLKGGDKVGVITRLFEDVEKRKKVLVRWFARPGAVWGPDGPDDESLGGPTLPYELYYTADSSHLTESRQLRERALLTSPQKKKSPSKSPSKTAYLSSVASLKTPLHSDALPLSSISSLCEVLSYTPNSPALSRSAQRLHPTFVVRKVYDVKPISGAGFWADLIDDEGEEEEGVGGWERLRMRGVEGWEGEKEEMERKVEGWEVEPVLEGEEEEERERERRIRERKKSIKAKGKGKEKVRVKVRDEGESESSGEEEEGEAFAPNRHSDASSSSEGEGQDSSSAEEDGEESEDDQSSEEDGTFSRTPTKPKRRNSQLPTPSSSLLRSTSASPKKRPRPPRTKTATTARPVKRRRKDPLTPSSSTHNSLPPLLSSAFLASLPSPLERAKALLHVSATPETLPCREEQRSRIRQFVEDAVLSRTGGCLYVHGVPGTGKTATVHSVVRELQNDPEMDPFTFVEINGMKISEPNTAFCHLWNALNTSDKSKPAKISPKAALSALEGWFANPDPARKTTVVLVDELDQMLSKRQEVLYNFFNWPHSAHSRLVVIAVANTMDLPERELSGKIRSRLGTNRIPFQPYNWNELKRILEARLSLVTSSSSTSSHVQLFEDTALQKIAKSVAGISGDARKALDVARRTLDRVALRQQEEGNEGVEVKCTIKDATAAYNEMTKNGMTTWVKNLSFHQKVLMLGLAQCIRRSGVLEVELDSVLSWHDTFLRQTHLIPSTAYPSKSDLVSCISDLHAQRLLATESARLDVFQKVRAMVEEGDVFAALREDESLKNHVPQA